LFEQKTPQPPVIIYLSFRAYNLLYPANLIKFIVKCAGLASLI